MRSDTPRTDAARGAKETAQMNDNSSDYYSRSGSINTDGRVMFTADADVVREEEIVRLIEQRWSVQVHRFGKLCPIDFYATKHGRMVAVIETKSRSTPSTQYPTVFLNVRKWLALGLAQAGLGSPALFFVRWSDGVIRYIKFNDIDARKVSMGGCKKVVKSTTDYEPQIEIPVSSMNQISP